MTDNVFAQYGVIARRHGEAGADAAIRFCRDELPPSPLRGDTSLKEEGF